MGAVVSCIAGMLRAVGACLMAIVNGIGAILQGIIGAIVSFFDILISCLTCGRGGGRRRGRHTTTRVSSGDMVKGMALLMQGSAPIRVTRQPWRRSISSEDLANSTLREERSLQAVWKFAAGWTPRRCSHFFLQPGIVYMPKRILVPRSRHNTGCPRPAHNREYYASHREPAKRQQHPVFPQPEDRLRILPVPTVPRRDVEDAPLVVAVLGRHEDAHVVFEGALYAHVLLPDNRQEERSGGGHDGDVWHAIVFCVGLEALNDALEEGMVGDGAHGVVTNSRWESAAHPGGVSEHNLKASCASVVEIKVDAAIVVEDEVTYRVGAWDGIDDTILEKERDKCAEGIYNKANNDKINGYDDLRASPH
ncbi:hypothetical protein V502_02380, partial [Pseudogymnoascus sp. VKM F-4520 (FW-2644)]